MYLETVNDAYTARKLYTDDVFYSDPLVSLIGCYVRSKIRSLATTNETKHADGIEQTSKLAKILYNKCSVFFINVLRREVSAHTDKQIDLKTG